MDIDSVGTFTMCHEALEYLKQGGPGRGSSSGGTILNISATLHYTAAWYQIHVSAAKVCNVFWLLLEYFDFYTFVMYVCVCLCVPYNFSLTFRQPLMP